MKTLLQTLFSLLLIAGWVNTQAQTYTMNWGTSFSPAWAAGNVSAKTTTTIGASGKTVTVNLVGTEATACSAFAGFTSPQVSSGGTPFATDLGANNPNLALGMDLASNTGYVEVRIKFSGAVNNVVFNISDIDKNNATSTTYFDEVVISGFNNSLPVTNPTLSKLNGTAVNNTTDTVIISGNIARSNTASGNGGNTPSSSTSQNGTVRVSFGVVALDSVIIRYRNAAGAQSNPAQQAIGIGNISFTNISTLPVLFSGFAGVYKNKVVELNWQTSQEINAAKFVVERSADGQNFRAVAEVAASGNSNTVKNYQATDANPGVKNYYRIRQVDEDGKTIYSKVILVAVNNNQSVSVKLYPNPVQSRATLAINSAANDNAMVNIYNANGMLVRKFSAVLNMGLTNIEIQSADRLADGMYVVTITANNLRIATTSFTKQ